MLNLPLLDISNIERYTAESFVSPCHTRQQFIDTLNLLNTAKGEISKYFGHRNDKNLRLLLNRVIILANEFGVEAAQRLLFFKCKDSVDHLVFLKTILTFLDWLEEPLLISSDLTIDFSIDIDATVFASLNNHKGGQYANAVY